ncbi:MAG: hypothetical protein LBM66_02085 [Bifidobacteriaceae bacterium]|jgi:hypothetical protein|nr:hypothetical protein [Bifidobacteriaceae bacterium]
MNRRLIRVAAGVAAVILAVAGAFCLSRPVGYALGAHQFGAQRYEAAAGRFGAVENPAIAQKDIAPYNRGTAQLAGREYRAAVQSLKRALKYTTAKHRCPISTNLALALSGTRAFDEAESVVKASTCSDQQKQQLRNEIERQRSQSPSPNPSGSGSGSGSASPNPSGSGSGSGSATASPNPSGSGSGSGSPSPSGSGSGSGSASASPSPSGSGSGSGSPSPSPGGSGSASPSPLPYQSEMNELKQRNQQGGGQDLYGGGGGSNW